MRIEDEDVDLGEAAERFDGGGAGVAGGRADDGRALAALLQHVVHHAAEQLHRQILEGERRAVEQFEHEEIVGDLRQRRDGAVAKAGIGGLGLRRAAPPARRRRSGRAR